MNAMTWVRFTDKQINQHAAMPGTPRPLVRQSCPPLTFRSDVEGLAPPRHRRVRSGGRTRVPVILTLLTSLVAPGPAARGDTPCVINWMQASPATSPSARTGHAITYDSVRGVTVLFGGHDGSSYLSDTWEWDGTTWAQRGPDPAHPETSPPARAGHAMAYDSARDATVLFGGFDGSNLLGDTWEWNGTAWSHPPGLAISPSPRTTPKMEYDSSRGRTWLFGGYDAGTDTYFGDTWEWDGANWSQRSPATSPPARTTHAMAYDIARRVTVLFGGFNGSVTPPFLGDTWEWNGTTWTQPPIPPATSPAARRDHAMAYDRARGVTVLFGGFSGSNLLNDTWEWDGTTWAQASPTTSPTARVLHAMAYDSTRGVTVLFGGADGGLLGDTWELVFHDADHDGVCDDRDACPNSDLRPTIVIGTCDTGVSNQALGGGCTMADEIANARAAARNHGQFVSAVAHLANDWRRAGRIGGSDKGRIQACLSR